MLKGAIVGIGKIAQTGHLPAYLSDQIRNRAEVIAAVDPSEQSRGIAAERYPSLRLYENVEQLFRNEKINFIDICATPQVHGQIINAAVRQRKHILCEKPFALSLKEAEGLSRQLREEKSLVFVPCHQYRFSPLWQHMKSFLSKGRSGDKWFLQFNVFRKEADPGLHVDGPAWRTKPDISGGGMIADTGVHYLYLSLWMMGMPYSVTARGYQLRGAGHAVEDTAFVVLESAKGVTQINLTRGADRRANSAHLLGKDGSISYTGGSLVQHWHDAKETIPVPDASDKSLYVSLYVSLIDEFINSIEKRKSTAAWIEEGYQTVKLLDACYTSVKEGRTITID